MKRIFGMMPSEEVTIRKSYKDDLNMMVGIDAGPNGWTIRYADGSSEFEDIIQDAEENFKRAFRKAEKAVGPLTEIKSVGIICDKLGT